MLTTCTDLSVVCLTQKCAVPLDPTGIGERDTSPKVKFWHGDAPPIFNLDGVPVQCI